MGMSASQARLMALTSRLHDVEFRAQHIEAQKLSLATQKDDVYQEYCDALDAKAYKVAFMNGANKSLVDANYSSLCDYNDSRYKNYALIDNTSGKMLVTEDIQQAYEVYKGDKYAFALAMMGAIENQARPDYNDYDSMMFRELGIERGQDSLEWYQSHGGYVICSSSSDDINENLIMTPTEYAVYTVNSSNSDLTSKLNKISEAYQKGNISEAREAYNIFREALYGCGADDIFNLLNTSSSGSDFNKREFNYYVNMFNAISEAGGCEVLDSQYRSGEEGNRWFKSMVEAGLVTIRECENDGSGKGKWSDTSVTTSINNNYLQEVDDDTDLKKAEAKYEHDLDLINRKDKKFDMELSKLETERTAIKTEMDSIGKVRDENIERTFNLFS